jgi:hypothetical protein
MTRSTYLGTVLVTLALIGCATRTATLQSPCPKKDLLPGSTSPPELVRMDSVNLSVDEQARMRGERVRLGVIIDATGSPLACSLVVLSGTDAILIAAVRRALLSSRWRPATQRGTAVPVWIEQPFIIQ